MKTKVINGVKCRMLNIRERAEIGDWIDEGTLVEPVSGVKGWLVRDILPAKIYRPISRKATGIEAKVCADIAERQRKGIAKYGTTVSENPLTDLQWARHLYEELLDASVYMRKIIASMEAKGK